MAYDQIDKAPEKKNVELQFLRHTLSTRLPIVTTLT